MSAEVAVREQTAPMATVLTNDQLTYIASTEFVPRGLRGNLPAILACVATGRAIGIDDMTAIRSIHVIEGKPSFSAELMVMLVRRAGHSITGDLTEGAATVRGTRADNLDSMTVTWTLEMAKRAGLAGKDNWKKYPEAMLWARAVSQLCRMLFADCFAGATYTTEELGDPDTGADGAPVVEDDRLFPPADQPEPGMATLAEPETDSPETAARDASAGDPQAGVAAGSSGSASAAQKKKLNVMVAKLRDAGQITPEQLWRSQNLDPENGRGEDGELHWSPLRDSLSKEQASELIERLTSLEARVTGESEFQARAEAAIANRESAEGERP